MKKEIIQPIEYVEPADYIPKDLRREYKLGEFAEDDDEEETEKKKK